MIIETGSICGMKYLLYQIRVPESFMLLIVSKMIHLGHQKRR